MTLAKTLLFVAGAVAIVHADGHKDHKDHNKGGDHEREGGMMQMHHDSDDVIQGWHRLDKVEHKCKDSIRNYCDDRDGDNRGHHHGDDDDGDEVLSTAACLLQNRDQVDQECLDTIAQEGFSPLFECSADLLSTCSVGGSFSDMPTQVRCQRDNLPTFAQTCQDAVNTQWVQQRVALGLADDATPTDFDVYNMLSAPRKPDWRGWRHFKGWLIGIPLVLVAMCLMCVCIRRCRKKKQNRAALALAAANGQVNGAASVVPSPSNAPEGLPYSYHPSSNSGSFPIQQMQQGQPTTAPYPTHQPSAPHGQPPIQYAIPVDV